MNSLIQPGPAPFGDITLGIRRTTPLMPNAAKKKYPTIGAFYELQKMADAMKSALLQEAMAGLYATAENNTKIVQGIDAFIEIAKTKSEQYGLRDSGAMVGGDWLECAKISRDWIAAGPDKYPCPSPIFAEGNNKLPYWAFSTIPGATCPGAGICLRRKNKKGKMVRGFCYSFKQWRFPATFFRQLNLTMLLRLEDPWHIREALDQIAKEKPPVILRLYVDGDIDSPRTLRFWMTTLKKYPMIRAYGYSKSWKLFLDYDKEYGDWPSNYALNLSSGSIYDRMPAMREAMKKLPITRGEFKAVEIHKIPKMVNGRMKMAPIPQNIINEAYLTPSQKEIFKKGKIPTNLSEMAFRRNPIYTEAVRKAAIDAGYSRPFVCPGKCGNCLGGGKHACGQIDVKVPIFIGVH